MVGSKERKVAEAAGMASKNGLVGALEALRDRFRGVFDIDIVLGYEFAEFFDFCQYLGYFGYNAGGFAGKLQSPVELVQHHVGNCWDQTELQREWFEERGYDVRTYLLYYYLTDDCCPSHSILVYQDGDAWCWFEPMFCGTKVEYSGVHRYESEEELLQDLKRVFALNGQRTGMLPKKLEDERWALYEYTRPKYGISDEEFYNHCRTGRKCSFD